MDSFPQSLRNRRLVNKVTIRLSVLSRAQVFKPGKIKRLIMTCSRNPPVEDIDLIDEQRCLRRQRRDCAISMVARRLDIFFCAGVATVESLELGDTDACAVGSVQGRFGILEFCVVLTTVCASDVVLGSRRLPDTAEI